METEMAIASIEFGNLTTTPSTPPSGKKVFLAADGKFSTIDSSGVVAPISGGISAYPNKSSFPVIGQDSFIYLASDTGTSWRWEPSASDYALFIDQIDAGTY